jgi:hypothetical protein
MRPASWTETLDEVFDLACDNEEDILAAQVMVSMAERASWMYGALSAQWEAVPLWQRRELAIRDDVSPWMAPAGLPVDPFASTSVAGPLHELLRALPPTPSKPVMSAQVDPLQATLAAAAEQVANLDPDEDLDDEARAALLVASIWIGAVVDELESDLRTLRHATARGRAVHDDQHHRLAG